MLAIKGKNNVKYSKNVPHYESNIQNQETLD